MSDHPVITNLAAKLNPSRAVTNLIAFSKAANRDRHFKLALDLVNAAIQNPGNDTKTHRASLLDARCLLRIRMRDWEAALTDAKSMIHVHRADVRGYLRCAQIERERKNLDTAVEHVRHGLTLSCVRGSQRELLTKEMAKLTNEIDAQILFSKPQDPLTTLPLEIVELIFQYLSYRQLIQMLRISKSYRMVMCSIRPIVDTLQFPEAEKVTPRMLQAGLGRWKIRKVIRTARLTDASLTLLKSTITSWQILETLEVFGVQAGLSLDWTLPLPANKLRSVFFDRDTHVPVAFICNSLLRHCPELEAAHFRSVVGDPWGLTLASESLQDLQLYFSEERPIQAPIDLLSGLPRLEKLNCTWLVFPAGSSVLDLRRTRLKDLNLNSCYLPNIHLPACISHLTIVQCIWLNVGHQGSAAGSFPALDSLERLCFASDTYPEFLLQAAAKTKTAKLRKVLLQEDSLEGESRLAELLETDWFKGVEVLEAWDCMFDDSHSQLFVSALPNIKELTIRESYEFTDAFIKSLIQAPGTKLKNISIRSCGRVPEKIVSWARGRGVKVTWEEDID
ncbi:hypothetical protein H2200_009598 [Cladophialophora chaetospira]|uniref:F-box domain-containing protein n=1 Tax=Cladophialophora chaetospira TaxID=386627 RepID=A0AA39CF01_9EURO|nr:hypothetical protein H2200_009598 [Cladophialophora chaetospira]